MFIAAIKCDFCNKAHEIPCRKTGDKPDVPDGWAMITPTIRIKGTPKKEWLGQNHPSGELERWRKPEDEEISKLYKKRRDELRKRFDKYHVCEDCIEEILTGKVSLKIGMDSQK